MKKLFNLIVLVVFLFVAEVQAKLFDMHEFYLSNGLQVVVIPNTKAPIIKQMIWYKAGSIDEPIGKGGIAHLLEHLMFRGTQKVKGSAFNDIIEQNGGDSNAFTSYDFTAYHEFLDISRLEVAMALEADRMRGLDISTEAFDTERKIVFQERQQRIANNPTAVFAENLQQMFWQNHPYSRPVTGTETEILGLTRQDALDFYERFYRPDNAILVLSGDIDVTIAKILAEKYFGELKKTPKIIEKNVSLQHSDNELKYRLEMAMADIATPRIIKKYRVPTLNENKRQSYALMLFSSYVGEGDNSYLNRHLVLEGKSTVASTSYNALAREGGTFSITAIPLPEQSVSEQEQLLLNTIRQAVDDLSEEDIQKEKQKMLSGLVYIKDNPANAAMLAGQMVALGLSLDEINAYEDNIKAITLDDIKQAVDDMLNNAVSATGILLPKESK